MKVEMLNDYTDWIDSMKFASKMLEHYGVKKCDMLPFYTETVFMIKCIFPEGEVIILPAKLLLALLSMMKYSSSSGNKPISVQEIRPIDDQVSDLLDEVDR